MRRSHVGTSGSDNNEQTSARFRLGTERRRNHTGPRGETPWSYLAKFSTPNDELSDAGLGRRPTTLIYHNHQSPAWLTEDATP